jgi:hypothetical protein
MLSQIKNILVTILFSQSRILFMAKKYLSQLKIFFLQIFDVTIITIISGEHSNSPRI